MDEGGRAGSPIEDEFLSKMKALIYSIAVGGVGKCALFMKLKVKIKGISLHLHL